MLFRSRDAHSVWRAVLCCGEPPRRAARDPKNQPYHLQGQTLHAGVLGFIHPSTKEYVEFSSELPEYFQKLLKQLEL